MTTDIRAPVVEAMAQAYKSATYGPAPQDDPDVWERCVEGASAALDAALDVLGERWPSLENSVIVGGKSQGKTTHLAVRQIINQLRAGKGSDE